jgi:ribonuclease P protein component
MDAVKKGKTLNFPFFTFRYLLNTKNPLPRFSVTVPKAVSKKAVDRNLLKRRVYSVVRKSISQIKPGVHGAFFLKKESLSVPYSVLEDEINQALKKTVL